MHVTIRENIPRYLEELKQWLQETADQKPEEMAAFFSARVQGYEEHMSIWGPAYKRFAGLLPRTCVRVLDLGCGTGLELDELWRRLPELEVTGVDLCGDMLEKLRVKHGNKKLTICRGDYFQYPFGEGSWDAIISFESLHHFLPDKKKALYHNIYGGLKAGAVFILGDYIACCEEEESLLRERYLEKRQEHGIPEDVFIHFDIPLTLEHEMELLRSVGFSRVEAVECIEGATMIMAEK